MRNSLPRRQQRRVLKGIVVPRQTKKILLARNSIIVGFALFAMFFGAGNLIFPPTLGQESGELWPLSLIAFLIFDAVLACGGVYVLAASGGPIVSIENAVGKKPALVLVTVATTCLCVLFAMPRTAATTFEISIAPYLGESASGALLPFSLIFFAIVFLLSMRESRMVDIIGRFFTPTLVVGVVVLVVVGIISPIGSIEAPLVTNVVEEGVRAGYQTMDVLGVVAFGIIIIDSAVVQSCETKKEKLNVIGASGFVTVLLLGLIYGGLAYLGATSESLGTNMSQVELLVAITQALLGKAGLAILGVVVLLACVTTAVALVGSAAAYFEKLTHIRYRILLFVDCVIGVLICNLGLDAILSIADPVLGCVYPPLLTVVVLLFFKRFVKRRGVYQGAALGALIAGFILELYIYGVFTALPLDLLPLYDLGFAWACFAVIGGIVGWFLDRSVR